MTCALSNIMLFLKEKKYIDHNSYDFVGKFIKYNTDSVLKNLIIMDR